MGGPRRWTVVWRDNVKPADFAEWEAIVAAAIEPYPGDFGVGFYETAEGWSFTTGWLDLAGLAADGQGMRAGGDPRAIRRPIHQALIRAGKPLARNAHASAHDPHAQAPAFLPSPARPFAEETRGTAEDPPTEPDRLTDAQVDALARHADATAHGALIRRLAAEVRALRDAMKKERRGAPGR